MATAGSVPSYSDDRPSCGTIEPGVVVLVTLGDARSITGEVLDETEADLTLGWTEETTGVIVVVSIPRRAIRSVWSYGSHHHVADTDVVATLTRGYRLQQLNDRAGRDFSPSSGTTPPAGCVGTLPGGRR